MSGGNYESGGFGGFDAFDDSVELAEVDGCAEPDDSDKFDKPVDLVDFVEIGDAFGTSCGYGWQMEICLGKAVGEGTGASAVKGAGSVRLSAGLVETEVPG